MKLWNMLAEKGKIATIIGTIFSVPCVIWLYINLFFGDKIITESDMRVVMLIMGFSMMWFILPSKISMKWGNGGIKVED